MENIVGFEGIYQISNLGRLRSLDRILSIKRFNKTYYPKRKGKLMSPTLNTNKYYHVKLLNGNKKQVYSLHRLVALHFLDNPNNYPIVNHIDSVKTNNRVDNLEWCTETDNRLHAREIFNDTAYGELCNLSKLTEVQVREIRANGKMGMSNKQIGILYNVLHETIRNVLNGRAWRHILDKDFNEATDH